MGTLATMIPRLRLRLKDKKGTEFTDTELISLVDGVMTQVFKELKRLESNLVVTEGTINGVAGTSDYTFAEASGFVMDSFWNQSPDETMNLVVRPDATAIDYGVALLADGQIRFMPTPTEDVNIRMLYFANYTTPTVDNMSTYDFPWSGIWNYAIERSALLEGLEILERSLGTAAIQAGDAWDMATMETYARGHIRRQAKGVMFP